MRRHPFTPDDLADLQAREIDVDEALRQLDQLRTPPAHRILDRACTVGDGIERVQNDEVESLIELHDQAAGQGRVLKFVPASGAATRMFQDLIVALEGSGEGSRTSWPAPVRRLLDELTRFAFVGDLNERLAVTGRGPDDLPAGARVRMILEALLEAPGLGYAELPKGLIKFHAYPDGGRTALEEHLVEAASYARDINGLARVHLTVSAEHIGRFHDRVEQVRPSYERTLGSRFQVDFSLQKPSTDTLAIDREGEPFRGGDERLLFRPAGHGALLENLAGIDADIIFVKNIDNVVPDRLKPVVVRWKKVLGGLLVRLQREVHLHVARLRAGDAPPSAVEAARACALARFGFAPSPGAEPSQARRALLEALDRPLRVCGVVPNVGEPGGGPFWVRGPDGRSTRQIVEAAEVDLTNAEQGAVLRSATHFNPVDLVCGIKDAAGRRFNLRDFIDPDAVIVARKSFEGRELVALERPGLWNGAMARWNTVFVEVPLETFAPVKSIFDLLRAEHQA